MTLIAPVSQKLSGDRSNLITMQVNADTMKDILLHYVKYNLWANTKITEALKSINSLLLDKEVKSSFPSLRKTTYHIWSAEEVWYKRLHGESPPFLPEPTNNFPEFAKLFSSRSQSFIELVKNKDENFLTQINAYKDTRGNPHSNMHWQMIMHCMNHSTFHRGQIITILREAGETKVPTTDLIVYFRELAPKS